MRAGGGSGWRSSRWRSGNGAAPAATIPAAVPVSPAPARPPRRGRRSTAAAESPTTSDPASPLTTIEERFTWPWQGVDFSVGYVAFLIYIFVISSYILNVGQAVIAGAILSLTMGGKDRWKFPTPMFFMAAFLLVIALTYKSTEFRNFTWTALQDITKVFLIATVAVSVLTTRARLRFFMFFYLAVFALFPVRGGVFNWFIYRAATQGRVAWNHLFENPNDYAALMIFPLGLCLATFVSERSKLIKRTSFVGIAAISMLIFMTQSRGAIVALGLGLFAYFILQGKGRAKTIVAIGAIAIVVFVFAPSGVWSRLSSLKSATESGNLRDAGDSNSAAQRFEIWKVAWSVHRTFPITGVGWGAYPNAHSAYSRRTGIENIARGARDSHNTYLTVLAETGWVGFLIWSSMIAAIVTAAIRAMQRIRPYFPMYAAQIKLLLLALFSYSMAAMFGSFAGVSFAYLHLATIIALTLVANKEVDALERSSSRSRGAL